MPLRAVGSPPIFHDYAFLSMVAFGALALARKLWVLLSIRAHKPPPQRREETMDDLVALVQEMMGRHWPTAEWVSLVVKRPDLPNLTFPITPNPDRGQTAESHQPSQLAP